MEEIQWVIEKEIGRIDKVLAEKMRKTRSQAQLYLKSGQVTVNGSVVKSNYKVVENDKVQVQIPKMKAFKVESENITLNIVYEDLDVLVVNKPQGMVVHPSVGHSTGTLVNALLYHIDSLSGINDVVRPGIVHRIDKDTSGLLMVAKNDEAHLSLSEQLKDHTSLRRYVALVHGNFSHDKGKIEAPIGRSSDNRKKQAVVAGGKSAVTHFKVLERFGEYTLLELELKTGRTHQIRVHMTYIEHPVAGDLIYGPRKTLKGKGQFLHAQTLGFKHPRTGEFLTFNAPLPEIFEKILKELRDNK
ncbi:MAG: RluA family pseudouridine synthase [Lactobacillales bacterium]|jgi:23S rRNA pseudouridine1911/1915/1917 synthase|nr:RluA family pseudouridine synthase [Lactobacillales bacterium]